MKAQQLAGLIRRELHNRYFEYHDASVSDSEIVQNGLILTFKDGPMRTPAGNDVREQKFEIVIREVKR